MCAYCIALTISFLFLTSNNDAQSLHGSWTIERTESQGQLVPIEETKNGLVTFTEGRMTARKDDKILNVYAYKIKATNGENHIDFVGLRGPDEGKTQLGIFEMKSEQLRLCVNIGKGDRPSSFQSKKGTSWILLVLKKNK